MNPMTFEWANRIVVIAPECMGYRSLTALVILGVALAIYNRMNFRRSLMLVGVASLLAIVGNLVRIGTILLVALFDADLAFGPVHDVAGYVTMLLATLALASVTDSFVKKASKMLLVLALLSVAVPTESTADSAADWSRSSQYLNLP